MVKSLENKIIEAVCMFFNQPIEKILSKSRKREYTEPRFIAMYFIKINTSMSLKSIGFIFGGRDHTTALNAVNNVKDWIDIDTVFFKKFNEAKKIVDRIIIDHYKESQPNNIESDIDIEANYLLNLKETKE